MLELGGSDPFIVLEDADLVPCVQTAIAARLINGGQSCIAAKRFIIHESLLSHFTELLVEKLKMIKIGDPLLEETDIGPMAREDLLETLERQIKESIPKESKTSAWRKKTRKRRILFSLQLSFHK